MTKVCNLFVVVEKIIIVDGFVELWDDANIGHLGKRYDASLILFVIIRGSQGLLCDSAQVQG